MNLSNFLGSLIPRMSDEYDASAAPSTFEPPTPEELAQLLPQYEVQDFIAQGGMGAVYLARQPALDRLVAIKVLPPYWGGEIDFAARFQIEARAMARLQHSNIVSVYDFGMTQEGHLYLVMEYVHGATLHQFIQARSLSTQHILSYALQLCDALQYAHEHGIIHRDIKPANVLVNEDGRVKVADFGLARPAAAHEHEVMMGTPDYAAPEITDGTTVDHRADIFALGVLIYEMLTGFTPSRSSRPASAVAGVDAGWDEVISKATRPLSKDRYATVKDMRAAISQVASRRRYAPGAHPPQSSGQQGGGAVKLLLLGFLLVALAAGFILWRRSHAEGGPSNDVKPPAKTEVAAAPATKGAGEPEESAAATEAKEGRNRRKRKSKDPALPDQEPLQIDFAKAEPGHLGAFSVGHKDIVWGIEILPDQKRAVSVGHDHHIMLWRIMTGELIRTTKISSRPGSCALSSDGQYLAVGCDDTHVRVYDVDSAVMKAEAPAPGNWSYGVCFSPDNRKVICTSPTKPNPIEIWPWADKAEPRLLEGWSYPITHLCTMPGTPEGRFVTVGGASKTADEPLRPELCVGSTDSPTPLQVLTVPVQGIPFRVAASPDQKYLAVSTGNVPVIFDLQTQKMVARCQGHGKRVDSMRFLDHGRLLLTGSEDKSLRIWECSSGKELWRVSLEEDFGTSIVTTSADETFALSAGGGNRPDRSWGKDDEARLHLWKLPVLANLHSNEDMASSEDRDLSRLSEVDPELAQLKSEFDSEWSGKIVKGRVADREDLDKRYVTYLQQKLQTVTPSERSPYLDEISRVSNNGPTPELLPAGAPLFLQQSMVKYKEQLGLLAKKNVDAIRVLQQSFEVRVSTLETLRKTQGNDRGGARARRFWLQWAKSHSAESAG